MRAVAFSISIAASIGITAVSACDLLDTSDCKPLPACPPPTEQLPHKTGDGNTGCVAGPNICGWEGDEVDLPVDQYGICRLMRLSEGDWKDRWIIAHCQEVSKLYSRLWASD